MLRLSLLPVNSFQHTAPSPLCIPPLEGGVSRGLQSTHALVHPLPLREGVGGGVSAQSVGGVDALCRRWHSRSRQQSRRERAAPDLPGTEKLSFRGRRRRWQARGDSVLAGPHLQAARCQRVGVSALSFSCASAPTPPAKSTIYCPTAGSPPGNHRSANSRFC